MIARWVKLKTCGHGDPEGKCSLDGDKCEYQPTWLPAVKHSGSDWWDLPGSDEGAEDHDLVFGPVIPVVTRRPVRKPDGSQADDDDFLDSNIPERG